MARSTRAKSFWSSAPGILTGIAGVLAAIAGLIVAIDNLTDRPSSRQDAHNASASTTANPPSRINRTSGDRSPIVSDTNGSVTIVENAQR